MAAGKMMEDEFCCVEQARVFLRDGEFRKAMSLLTRAHGLSPSSARIGELIAIAQVCSAAAWKCTCRLQAPKPKNPDWYRILEVEESADAGSIRKRYRQLALLLHPDKNKNVRAEEAFKLVSEAYACLSDRNSRKSFNVERLKAHCARCSSGKGNLEAGNEEWRSEQEKLQFFRDKARARVSSLTHDIRTRRSRWNADLETARERYQNKRVDRKSLFTEDILGPLRESDVFQPGRRFQESDLMSILKGRRFLHREKPDVSQSLDGLLNKLRRETQDETDKDRSNKKSYGEVVDNTPHSSKHHPHEELLAEAHFAYLRGESCDIKSFSRRAEALPAKKLFKENGGEYLQSTEAATDYLRRQSFPVFDSNSTVTEENSFAANSDLFHDEVNSFTDLQSATGVDTTPTCLSRAAKSQRNNLEPSGLRTEYAESTPFCCGSTKKTALKEQRQKSEELLKTLERLRQEAKSVAATLDNLKQRVDSTSTD